MLVVRSHFGSIIEDRAVARGGLFVARATAACTARADNHWVDDLYLETGTRIAETPIASGVALNGQQFVATVGSLVHKFDTSRTPAPLSSRGAPLEQPEPPFGINGEGQGWG